MISLESMASSALSVHRLEIGQTVAQDRTLFAALLTAVNSVRLISLICRFAFTKA
jgi:hypothetical protein